MKKKEEFKEKKEKSQEVEKLSEKEIWKINREQQLRLNLYDVEFELNFNNLILKNTEEEVKKQTQLKSDKQAEILKLGHTLSDRKKRGEIVTEISQIGANINRLQSNIQPTQKTIADNINQLNYLNNKIVFLKKYPVKEVDNLK